LVIAAGHVLVLGLPGFLALRKLNAIRWWSTVGTGFLLGCIPIAVWAWPLKYPGLSSSHWDGEKMVQTMVDGVPTVQGWLSYVEGVLYMGIFGAISGLGFWLIWRRNETQQRAPSDRHRPAGAAGA
jgi:hypothetical protein